MSSRGRPVESSTAEKTGRRGLALVDDDFVDGLEGGGGILEGDGGDGGGVAREEMSAGARGEAVRESAVGFASQGGTVMGEESE